MIAGVLTLAATKKMESKQGAMNLDSVNKGSEVLSEAMGSYYVAHCNDPVFAQPTTALLVDQGYLFNEDYIELPLGLNFVPSIAGVGTNNVQINIAVNMPNEAMADTVARANNFATAVGVQVQWVYKPKLARKPKQIRFQQARETFGNPLC